MQLQRCERETGILGMVALASRDHWGAKNSFLQCYDTENLSKEPLLQDVYQKAVMFRDITFTQWYMQKQKIFDSKRKLTELSETAQTNFKTSQIILLQNLLQQFHTLAEVPIANLRYSIEM